MVEKKKDNNKQDGGGTMESTIRPGVNDMWSPLYKQYNTNGNIIKTEAYRDVIPKVVNMNNYKNRQRDFPGQKKAEFDIEAAITAIETFINYIEKSQPTKTDAEIKAIADAKTARQTLTTNAQYQDYSLPSSILTPIIPKNITTATENKEKITTLIANAQKIVDDMANPKNSGKYTNKTDSVTAVPAISEDTIDINTYLPNSTYNREGMLKLVQAYIDKAIALVIETNKLLVEPQIGGRRKSRKAKK